MTNVFPPGEIYKNENVMEMLGKLELMNPRIMYEYTMGIRIPLNRPSQWPPKPYVNFPKPPILRVIKTPSCRIIKRVRIPAPPPLPPPAEICLTKEEIRNPLPPPPPAEIRLTKEEIEEMEDLRRPGASMLHSKPINPTMSPLSIGKDHSDYWGVFHEKNVVYRSPSGKLVVSVVPSPTPPPLSPSDEDPMMCIPKFHQEKEVFFHPPPLPSFFEPPYDWKRDDPNFLL